MKEWIEVEFIKLKKKFKMSFAELESIEYQIQVLDSFSIEQQISSSKDCDRPIT